MAGVVDPQANRPVYKQIADLLRLPILIVLVVVLATAFAIGGKADGLLIAGVSIGMMAVIALVLVIVLNYGGGSGGSGRPGGGNGGDGGGGC